MQNKVFKLLNCIDVNRDTVVLMDFLENSQANINFDGDDWNSISSPPVLGLVEWTIDKKSLATDRVGVVRITGE
jgi:hypothetical protein